MRQILAVLLFIAATAAPAAAQRGFIGVDDDPQLGDAAARVTIIEFGDFQCPFCRQFWRETLPRLRKEYIDTSRVRFVYRDFPQESHPEAVPLAMAAHCAGDQGRYWEFHDRIFREQDRRGRDVVRVRTQDIKRWAVDLKLDAPAFDACLDSGKYEAEVKKDLEDGLGVGIPGTPMFFINGRVLGGAHPYSAFQKVIEEELRK